ncbi:MAG TPA: chemotaxis protein CheX [Labilithrix sp.]|nr:chemotaxis protein CheX [Labilithrix sp.]
MKSSDIAMLVDILGESCEQAFGLLRFELLRVESTVGEFSCAAPVAAIVGIGGGGLRGTITMVGPFALMSKSYPLDLRKEADAALDVLDWTGEIANQLAGFMTNRLGSTGVEVFASTPKVILTEQLSNVSLSRGSLCELRFLAEAGMVGVWLDAVSTTDEAIFVRRDSVEPIAKDLVIFE